MRIDDRGLRRFYSNESVSNGNSESKPPSGLKHGVWHSPYVAGRASAVSFPLRPIYGGRNGNLLYGLRPPYDLVVHLTIPGCVGGEKNKP